MQIKANGIDIEVEDSGPRDGPAVLLITGLGSQLIHWPPALVQALVDAGYRVIRFDNRDSGLAKFMQGGGKARLLWVGLQAWLGRTPRTPYTLRDMAADSLDVLDALAIERAHIVGISMGGMIAQRVALAAPERCLSLVSISSSSGKHFKPEKRVLQASRPLPPANDLQAREDYYVRFLTAISSHRYPPEPDVVREVFRVTTQRSPRVDGVGRQMCAVLADHARQHELAAIRVPTLVMHGSDDPWLPPSCGEDTARRIPGARYALIDGLGHDLIPLVQAPVLARVLPPLLDFLAEPGGRP